MTDARLGRMNGARKRGIPRQIWLDTIKGYASGATISNMRRDATDKAGWRGAATAVARGRLRLKVTSSSPSSSLGSRCALWLGEGLSMPSPNYPVLYFPLPYRVTPVFV